MRMDNFRETLKEIVVSKTRLQNNTTTNKAVSFQGRQTMESKDIEEIIRSRNQKNIFENGTQKKSPSPSPYRLNTFN